MIALAWTLGSIAAYLGIGWAVAVWDTGSLFTRLRERTYREYDYYQSKYVFKSKKESIIRVEARWYSISSMLGWPVRVPYLLVVRSTDKRDPVRLQEQLDARDRTIAELEKAMQVGKTQEMKK